MFDIGTVVKVKHPSIQNQLGGTTYINITVKARITEKWYDYETGYRFIGELINKRDINTARQAGITLYKPDDYKDYPNKELYTSALEAYNNYNPKIVYFSEFDIH